MFFKWERIWEKINDFYGCFKRREDDSILIKYFELINNLDYICWLFIIEAMLVELDSIIYFSSKDIAY